MSRLAEVRAIVQRYEASAGHSFEGLGISNLPSFITSEVQHCLSDELEQEVSELLMSLGYLTGDE